MAGLTPGFFYARNDEEMRERALISVCNGHEAGPVRSSTFHEKARPAL